MGGIGEGGVGLKERKEKREILDEGGEEEEEDGREQIGGVVTIYVADVGEVRNEGVRRRRCVRGGVCEG